MPEPIEYRVIRNLQAALQAIAVSSGFYHDVEATAVKLDPEQEVEELVDPEGPRPLMVLALGEENWQHDPASQVVLSIPVTIIAVHRSTPPEDAILGEPSVTPDELRQQIFWRLCADVEKAIAADISRGGLATDTRIVKRSYDGSQGQDVWAEVETRIRLHRTYGVPA